MLFAGAARVLSAFCLFKNFAEFGGVPGRFFFGPGLALTDAEAAAVCVFERIENVIDANGQGQNCQKNENGQNAKIVLEFGQHRNSLFYRTQGF